MKHSCKLQGVTDSNVSYFYCIEYVTNVGSVFFRTFIFRTVYDGMTVSGLRKYRVEGYVTSGECRVVSARRREGVEESSVHKEEDCRRAGWKTARRPNNRRNASHHS